LGQWADLQVSRHCHRRKLQFPSQLFPTKSCYQNPVEEKYKKDIFIIYLNLMRRISELQECYLLFSGLKRYISLVKIERVYSWLRQSPSYSMPYRQSTHAGWGAAARRVNLHFWLTMNFCFWRFSIILVIFTILV
jgi:hypothetical protein